MYKFFSYQSKVSMKILNYLKAKTHYSDPFWFIKLYYFLRMCMLSVSHLKLLKYFHNIFAYYVRIKPVEDIIKEIILFHLIKWGIGIYLWKQM